MNRNDIFKKLNKKIFKKFRYMPRDNYDFITYEIHKEFSDYISLPKNRKQRDKYLDNLINLIINLRLSED